MNLLSKGQVYTPMAMRKKSRLIILIVKQAVYNYVDKTVERYSYDMYNNIKRAELYVHDGELGDLISCDVYENNSEINTDRITCINGAEISYDEIGNPLTYYDGIIGEKYGMHIN